jgi:uncharacterized protein
MRSRIYECHVMHDRTAPKRHRFVHRVFMLALDLDELPAVDRVSRLLSVNAANLYSVREDDYFPVDEPVHNPSSPGSENANAHQSGWTRTPGPRPSVGADEQLPPHVGSHVGGVTSIRSASLKERVLGWLAERGIDLPGGRVELVTMPCIAGYHFNPVSFYFCFDAAGRPAAAIAEVTNTFREVKPYLLGPSAWRDGAFRLRVPKHFYVSPYSDVDVAFDFTLRPPGERLSIQIDDTTNGERTLRSTLAGPSRPLTGGALAWCTLKYPLLTLAVMTLIHVHALALYLKKVPWFSKANRPADQRDLHRPHRSLSRIAPAKATP